MISPGFNRRLERLCGCTALLDKDVNVGGEEPIAEGDVRHGIREVELLCGGCCGRSQSTPSRGKRHVCPSESTRFSFRQSAPFRWSHFTGADVADVEALGADVEALLRGRSSC